MGFRLIGRMWTGEHNNPPGNFPLLRQAAIACTMVYESSTYSSVCVASVPRAKLRCYPWAPGLSVSSRPDMGKTENRPR